MPLDLHRWVDDSRTHIAALQKPQRQIVERIAELRFLTRVETWSDAAAAGEWKTLDRAATVVAECANALESIRAQQTRVRPLTSDCAKLRTAVRGGSLFSSDEKRWRSFQADVTKRLGRRRSDALRQLKSMNVRTLCGSLDELTKDFSTSLETATRAQLAMMSAAETALAIGRLNSPQRVSGTPEDFIAHGEGELNAAEHQVWSALSRRNLRLAGKSGMALAKSGRGLLEATASHAAAVAARHGRSGASVTDGPLALRFGDLLVALVRGCVLGEHVASIVANGEDTKQARRWIDGARKRKLASQQSERSLKSIASLAARPTAQRDGSRITVEGTVISMEELGSERKMAYAASVADPSGAVLTVVAKDAPLETAGITVGASIRASGRWCSKLSWTKRPALLLEPLIPTTTTWDDWASAELSGIVAPDPHAFAIATSWETGPDGAANRLRFGRWLTPAMRT